MKLLAFVLATLFVALSSLSSIECHPHPHNKLRHQAGLPDDPPIIQTKYGSIKGVSSTIADMYLGIPFAQPPLNERRWAKPADASPWYPNVLSATELKPACPQADCASRMPNQTCPMSYSEDCLYLNVFVPKGGASAKAVMLFIHGGNFQFQGANSKQFNGTFFASFGDVIVVTIEYRIGALGFLMTGTGPDQIEGNFGIMDQRMAMRWVKENIASFGGDASRITIFGQSAGAESVTLHLLSVDMQDTFNNAIIQSSPMAIPFRKLDEAMILYYYFAKNLSCAINDIQCLRSKTADEIVASQMFVETKVSSLKLLEFAETWLPWIDGKLVKASLLEIEKWDLPKGFTLKSFIMGSLTEECLIYINLGFKNPVGTSEYAGLMLAGFKQHGVKVLNEYPPDFKKNDQRSILSDVATRWIFGCSTRNFLEKTYNATNAAGINTTNYYYYIYDFPLDFPGWGDNFSFCDGHVCHSSDIYYTFDSADGNFTSNGKTLSRSHMYYWSNFAKTNTPNGPLSQYTPWLPYEIKTKPFLRFRSPQDTSEHGYLRSECDFFDSIGYIY